MTKFEYKNNIGEDNASILRWRNAIAMDFSREKCYNAHRETFETLVFRQKNDVIEWPSVFPDLNHIENL